MSDTAPAGWYPHPEMPGTQGYWDGEKWTDHVAPAAPVPVLVRGDRSWMVPVGWVCAVLLPIAGFIIACLLPKEYGKHQAGMILVSIAAAVFYYLFFLGFI